MHMLNSFLIEEKMIKERKNKIGKSSINISSTKCTKVQSFIQIGIIKNYVEYCKIYTCNLESVHTIENDCIS